MKITKAMLLAAGLGERMQPLTLQTPKPLLQIKGQSFLDHMRQNLKDAGVHDVVINAFHLAEKIKTWALQNRAQAIVEKERLETGGGVLNALPFLGKNPFFAANGDVYTEGQNPFKSLQTEFHEKDDVLLLLIPKEKAWGYDGPGDYFMDTNGHITRNRGLQDAPYVFGGVQILTPSIFEGLKIHPFSLLEIYDAAEEKKRLRGVVFQGSWYHFSTPSSLESFR